jgi:hypothetical protein
VAAYHASKPGARPWKLWLEAAWVLQFLISGVRAMTSSMPWISVVVGVVFLAGAAAPVSHAQVNFSSPPAYAGTGTLFVADFNLDGKPDILTASAMLNLGVGDGTFTSGTPVTGQPLAVADFNGDGKSDILEQSTGTLLVLLGNGDGTFQPPISTPSGASLTAVIAGDLGNGHSDVLGISNNALQVYLGNGDGTFASAASYSLGTSAGVPTLTMFGDFNGDGKSDVAVLTEGTPGQVIVFLGNGDGTLRSTPLTSAGVDDPLSAVAGDFNGDGKLDLAILTLVTTSNLQVATAFLQPGKGDGTFQPPAAVCTGPYSGEGANGFESVALAAADLNGDGKLDLVLTADLIAIYLGNGDGTFSTTPAYYQPMSSGGSGIAIADFNLDGKPDVAADGEILFGEGNGRFQGPPTVLLPSYAGLAAVGRFVKNGAPGVAAVSNSPNRLYILTNDGTGILSLANTYTLQQPSYGIATGDVNGDGNLDLIVTGADPNSSNWSYTVLLGNGNGSFQPPVLYQQNIQAIAFTVVTADFNKDGKLDFAVPTGNSVAVLLGHGDGTFASPALFFDGEADSIVSADFNGDGNPDIAGGGSSGLAILFGNGNGTFQPAVFPSTTGIGGVLTADLNGDGKADIIGYSGGIMVLLGNGDGTFDKLAPFGSNGQSIAVGLADVNGDGNLDLISEDTVGSTVTNGVYLGNGDGTFDTSEIHIPYNYPPHSLFPSVTASDMNEDGKPDLIIASPLSTAFLLINSTAPVPGARLSPSSVTFSSQPVGTGSKPTPVTVTNPGSIPLTVKSVTLGGANAGEFKQTNDCTTVQPLASCTINVTFAPSAAGGFSANLVVEDDAFSGSQQVVISGTAVVPGFTISAAALQPASVAPGGSATTTVAIASVGGFNQSVTLSCSITLNGAPATSAPPTCNFSPPSVNNASGTSNLTISTTASSASLAPVVTRSRRLFYAMLLPILGVSLMGTKLRSSTKRRLRMSLGCLVISGSLILGSCGGGNNALGGGGGGPSGTPAGTYTILISGSAGATVAKPATVKLTVQ